MNRLPSIGLEWSDSDSSVDSMPDSDSDFEGDWPRETGFMVRTCTCDVSVCILYAHYGDVSSLDISQWILL